LRVSGPGHDERRSRWALLYSSLVLLVMVFIREVPKSKLRASVIDYLATALQYLSFPCPVKQPSMRYTPVFVIIFSPIRMVLNSTSISNKLRSLLPHCVTDLSLRMIVQSVPEIPLRWRRPLDKAKRASEVLAIEHGSVVDLKRARVPSLSITNLNSKYACVTTFMDLTVKGKDSRFANSSPANHESDFRRLSFL
jgi:hypothetical protein